MSTPKGHRIDLDDENDVISVTDGKNKLDISGKSGSVELTCEKKLTIKVGSGVTITCDGNSGAVEIKTNSKIELNSAKIGVKASGEASVEGSRLSDCEEQRRDDDKGFNDQDKLTGGYTAWQTTRGSWAGGSAFRSG